MEVAVNAVVETVINESATDESPDSAHNELNSEECGLANQNIKKIKSHTSESEKHSSSAVWTTDSTITLLKLYETKLEMLETPKKKTRIWIAISENLKDYNIEMSPDQVRWKINALAKKYKHCIDTGQQEKFKYFKEMDNVYSQYNVDCDSYSVQNTVLLQQKKINSRKCQRLQNESASSKSNPETKAMVELRKRRLAHRMEAERSQSKINLEQQWLEYLRRQEEQKKLKDDMFERQLRLREEQLELKKRELEMKESLELKNIELKEREQNEMLKVEREKCEMLKKIFAHI